MRVRSFSWKMQVLRLFIPVFIFLGFSACRRSSEEIAVMPPATHPLSREFLGYGVINISFAHLLREPVPGEPSLGYLRRGTVVRIIERKKITNNGLFESWVLAEGNYQTDAQESPSISRGWLIETALEIYENEFQAKTAAKSMSQ